jgi:DNA-binding MarR family transcriptional regulator
MGELAQLLVERGWLTRAPDPHDRRQSLLQLTDEGRSHYERASDLALRRLVPIIDRLSAAELAAVQLALPALHRVLTSVEEETLPGEGRS